MYYNTRKMILSIIWVIIGATLMILDFTGMTNDPIYSSMGAVFLVIGIMQIVKKIRYQKDPEYREKVDIAYKDERNGYIRMKAWSWAGYLFVIGAAVLSIGFNITKMRVYGQILGYCICAIIALYWISYMILSRKY